MPQIVWIILIVLLLIAALGGAPNWGWHSYGWAPSGGLGLVLLIVLILLIAGRL